MLNVWVDDHRIACVHRSDRNVGFVHQRNQFRSGEPSGLSFQLIVHLTSIQRPALQILKPGIGGQIVTTQRRAHPLPVRFCRDWVNHGISVGGGEQLVDR